MRGLSFTAALLSLPLAGLSGEPITAAGMNRFGTDLYQQLAHGQENLVFSPLCNVSVLSMLLDGARGTTASQLAQVLHQTYPDNNHYQAVSGFLNELKRRGNAGGGELTLANGVWTQRGMPLLPEYQRILTDYYHASAAQYDFAEDPEQARAAINEWAASQTKGKLPELFGQGTISRQTRLVVASAVYFHGEWQSQFRASDTRSEPFHTGARETVSVPMMAQTGDFGYAGTPAVEILEMRYSGSPLVFDVLLPRSAEGLGELEASLSPEKLAGYWHALGGRKVTVTLPRFRVQTSVSLRDAISRLGAPEAFSGSADFRGIAGRAGLALEDVLHQASVEVSEEGTVAAAASGGAVSLTSAGPPPVAFRADHPFLFLIRDPETGIILFAGRLMKPKG